MEQTCRPASALLFALATALLGTWAFGSGFLLHRIELGLRSQCGHEGNASSRRDCWSPRRFDRAVVVVVDALRLDFVKPFQPGAGSLAGGVAPFHNRMPFLGSLAADQSGRARLYAFEADPPTVTMQRLKALTTGSLPTFVDVGRSFAGGAITEDNILSQAGAAGLRTVFVGDDTWSSLFPAAFADARPFPSFNVQDLHTVDNGVIGTLVPGLGLEAGARTSPRLRGAPGPRADHHFNDSHSVPRTRKRTALLARSNASADLTGWLQGDALTWDIAIAHMLGVDHVGHRVGPYHPAMGQKLEQTDRVLAAVWDALPGDTLFVVLGDHGMTAGGNHGGASPAETHAALVLAAKSPLFDTALAAGSPSSASLGQEPGGREAEDGDWFGSPHRCRQVDLVPTLSFLLGLPVPAASMGVLLPGLRYARPGELGSGESPSGLLEAETRRLLQNAEQVSRYIEAYARAAPSFLDDRMQAGLRTLLRAQEQTRHSLRRATAVLASNTALRGSLAAVASLCRKRWTQFDEAAMGRGVLLVGAGAGLSLRVWAGTPHVRALSLVAAALAGLLSSWAWQALSRVEMQPGLASEPWLWGSRESYSQLLQWVKGAVGDGPNAVSGVGVESAARLAAWIVSAAMDNPAAAAALAASTRWMLAGSCPPSRGASTGAQGAAWRVGSWAAGAAAAARCATLWSNSYLEHEATIVGALGSAVVVALLAQRWKEGRPTWQFSALAAATAVLGYGSLQSRALHTGPQSPGLVLASGCAAGTGVLAALCLVVAAQLGGSGSRTARAVAVAAACLAGGGVVATLLHGWLEHAAAENLTSGPAGPRWAAPEVGLAGCARWALGLSWASVALLLVAAVAQGRGAETDVARARPALGQSALLALTAVGLALCPAVGVLGGLAGFVSVSLAAFHCMAIVALASWDQRGGDPSLGGSTGGLQVGWGAMALYLAAWTHFFGTGHSASFASLRFSAAFVGFDDVDFLRGGAAVAADTLVGPLVASLGVAGLAFVTWLPSRRSSRASSREAAGPAAARLPLGSQSQSVSLVAAWQCLWLAALVSSAGFVLFARRHLMVWAVFAPKLCFDVGCSAVALGLGLLVIVCSGEPCRRR